LILILLAALPATSLARLESAQVTLDYVAKKAEQRARKPFRSPRADLPAVLRQDNLDYDKYREIEFRHEKALWTSDNLPFRIEFFHPGYLYQEPVHVNEFTLTHVQSIRFVQDFFYRAQKQKRATRTPVFAFLPTTGRRMGGTEFHFVLFSPAPQKGVAGNRHADVRDCGELT
jgi:glucan biosynthesis protein